jgi:hypothetical protein
MKLKASRSLASWHCRVYACPQEYVSWFKLVTKRVRRDLHTSSKPGLHGACRRGLGATCTHPASQVVMKPNISMMAGQIVFLPAYHPTKVTWEIIGYFLSSIAFASLSAFLISSLLLFHRFYLSVLSQFFLSAVHDKAVPSSFFFFYSVSFSASLLSRIFLSYPFYSSLCLLVRCLRLSPTVKGTSYLCEDVSVAFSLIQTRYFVIYPGYWFLEEPLRFMHSSFRLGIHTRLRNCNKHICSNKANKLNIPCSLSSLLSLKNICREYY